MRNFSKNKFFLCFRPVVDIDAMLESKVSSHRSEKKLASKFSESWIKQHSPKRTVLKVIKAVVLETILNRRARYSLDYFGVSKNNYSTYKKVSKASQSPLPTLTSHSSSSLSSKVSQSKNMSIKGRQKEGSNEGSLIEKQKKFEFYAMCLVLMSLAFTVFWGKLSGIIMTSIWLYFFSLWNSNHSCQKMLQRKHRHQTLMYHAKNNNNLRK